MECSKPQQTLGLRVIPKKGLDAYYDWAEKTDNMYLEIFLAFALSLVVATTCVYFGKFIKQSVWVRNIAYGEIAKEKH